MAEIRADSDIVIDTSDLNIHQLATTITERFQAEHARGPAEARRALVERGVL